MDAQTLLSRADTVLSNPFVADGARPAAEATIGLDGISIIDGLKSAGGDKTARRVAVALSLTELRAGRRPAFLESRGNQAGLLSSIGLDPRAVGETARAAVRSEHALRELAGESNAIQAVRATAWQACFGESVYEAIRLRPLIREQNILILGETGTGKEVLAQAIAAAESTEDSRQALNAAAIPRELLESELFGHTRGAFTGAHSERIGKIAAADGGTLFLDEIADLPEALQVKLLRVLEEGVLTPLGSNAPVQVDVRYVCATSQPIDALVEGKGFRLDLYQRLAGATIAIPPLRERPEDLRPIARHLFARHRRKLDSGGKGTVAATESTAHLSRLSLVEARFLAWLEKEGRTHPWTGNVRELQSLVRSWVLGSELKPSATNSTSDTAQNKTTEHPELERFLGGQATLRELENWYIARVFAMADYRQRKAARILDIDRGTLARRLKAMDEE